MVRPLAAVGDGVIVDLGRIRTMSEVEPMTHQIWIGPGVTRAVVEHAANDLFPQWSPAGDRVFFASDRTGALGL